MGDFVHGIIGGIMFGVSILLITLFTCSESTVLYQDGYTKGFKDASKSFDEYEMRIDTVWLKKGK